MTGTQEGRNMAGKSHRQQLEEMVAADPGDPETRYFLAMDYVSQGDDAGAVRCFNELIQLVPDYPPAFHQCAQALVRLGRIAQAQEVLQRGITVAAKKGNAHARDEMQGLLDSLE
jgi:cytochrome c-type biogenesis protein CcmH/NrfG